MASAWTCVAHESPPASRFPDVAKLIYSAVTSLDGSKTLANVTTARTRLEPEFDAEAVQQMKARSEFDISVGGPDLAAQAIKAGLVDEIHLFLTPILVGGGKSSLPKNFRVNLELLDQRSFRSGVIHLHYRTKD